MTGAVAAGLGRPCTAGTKGIGYSVGEPAGLDTATVDAAVVAAAAAGGDAAVVGDGAVQGLENVVVRAEKTERGSNSFCQSTFLVVTLISD